MEAARLRFSVAPLRTVNLKHGGKPERERSTLYLSRSRESQLSEKGIGRRKEYNHDSS